MGQICRHAYLAQKVKGSDYDQLVKVTASVQAQKGIGSTPIPFFKESLSAAGLLLYSYMERRKISAVRKNKKTGCAEKLMYAVDHLLICSYGSFSGSGQWEGSYA